MSQYSLALTELYGWPQVTCINVVVRNEVSSRPCCQLHLQASQLRTMIGFGDSSEHVSVRLTTYFSAVGAVLVVALLMWLQKMKKPTGT